MLLPFLLFELNVPLCSGFDPFQCNFNFIWVLFSQHILMTPHSHASCLLFSAAVRPGVQGGDAAERHQERDPQRTLHCADGGVGSHPGLPVLHRWLHFL